MAKVVDEVAEGVFRGRGTEVNWFLIRDGDVLTLVDTGYPGDAERVEDSVRTIGCRPQDVRAVLLTHAHVDHMGAANRFHDRYGTPVYTDAVEVRHAHREYLEQANARDVAANLWRPGLAPWLARVVRAGVLKKVRIPSAEPFPDGAALPGGPVAVPTRGHTSGHTAFYFPAARAVATGDELVTGHGVLRDRGPRVLPAFFNHGDPSAGLTALAQLDADLILPGHGEPMRIPIAEAVAEARAHAG
jgi:glyoxylase-like metal-dependent hydrolase (beta-lactamase superfamily II)